MNCDVVLQTTVEVLDETVMVTEINKIDAILGQG